MATRKGFIFNEGEYYEVRSKTEVFGKAYRQIDPDGKTYLQLALEDYWIISDKDYKKLKYENRSKKK